MREEKMRKIVRERYGEIAKTKSCCSSRTCSGTSSKIGYSEKELKSVPEGADLSLGCGNPVALASLREGETVIDLGSGGGLDCFLASKIVGEKGKVIGVDMTPEMIDKARENCRKGKYKNVEFRLGEIENLPVADNTADAIISNCVVNLSPKKKRVFQEAFRALKPSGRLMVSDIVLLKELPDAVRNNVQAYVGCVGGAVMKDEYLESIREAGFQKVRIVEEEHFPLKLVTDDPEARTIKKDANIPIGKVKELVDSIASIRVCGVKPDK